MNQAPSGAFLLSKKRMNTENEGAAAPADEQAVTAPAESEQATPNTSAPNGDADPENAETEGQETDETEGQDKPERTKLTRNQRLQRKAARLSTMVAEQAAELERYRQASSQSDAASEPKEADYNGDWTKFQADYAAWKAAQTIRGEFNEREQREAQRRLNERRQEAADDFTERADQLKTQIADYDKVIEGFANAGGKFEPHVIEELLDSDHGPMLAYQIAKQPSLAAQLNSMSPRDAAREIGRLEAKVSLPQPRKQTQAPPPVAPLSGGGSPKSQEADLSAWLKQTYGERRA